MNLYVFQKIDSKFNDFVFLTLSMLHGLTVNKVISSKYLINSNFLFFSYCSLSLRLKYVPMEYNIIHIE